MTDHDMGGETRRPSPDALLADASGEQRASLKIFFGAAPGVGKTFEMLQVGRERKAQGTDVVIGVVETHGRLETEKLLEGFEIIPRRDVEYRGKVIEELDLDAVLKRRPELVLVDELAHTNAPGSRHPKRYLDVLELLDAGIDVYTTLNVQHLESLNDVVAQITRIRVRETVPDSILDRADQIEVIDVTPETLTQRLKEGKVYVRAHAERALRHYFSPGNLTALRELALRRTAARVDDQMRHYMRSHAIEGPWAAGDRILVCVAPTAASADLVRYARRVADRLQAPWSALHVETDQDVAATDTERNHLAEALRLTEQLGGTAITISGQNVAPDILAYARANNFTHIIVGNSRRSRLHEFVQGSKLRSLVRGAGNISIHIMAGDIQPENTAVSRRAPLAPGRPDRSAYGAGALFTIAATAAALVLQHVVPRESLALVYLTAVLFSATMHGLWPAIATSLMSVAAFNFFFLPPLYTFTIADPRNVVSLFFFLVVALVTSNLAAQIQRHARITARRAALTEELYAFARKLAGIGVLDDLLWTVAYQIASMLEAQVVILLPDDSTLRMAQSYPPGDILAESDMAAALWTWHNGHGAGRGADTLPGADRLYLPVKIQTATLAVVGLRRDALLSPDERRLLDALLHQMAVSLERINLTADVERAKLQAEAERVRNAFLTSVSHDLRTPISMIIGALTSVKSYAGHYQPALHDELIATALDEAERLNRFVGNLLDITRIEAGGVTPKREPVDLGEIVGSALERAGRLLAHHRLEIGIPADLPLVCGDPVLIEQVVFNLLDNAAKYAPDRTTIQVAAMPADARSVALFVSDEGPGIPPESLEAIFEKFMRIGAADRQRPGTGLGLQICRGFVTAMNGSIVAANRPDHRGAIFTITLPVAAVLPPMQDAPAPERSARVDG